MWYVFIIMGVLAVFSFGTMGCKQLIKKSYSDKDISPDDTIKGKFKREYIKEKLTALAESPDVKELKPGAMCYAAVQNTDSIHYVCPKCGEKTLYTAAEGFFVARELSYCRGYAAAITEIELKLDESQFCKKCSPRVKNPELCIDYKFADDEKTTEVCNITLTDLQLISEFLQGNDKHKTFNDGEEELKLYVPRLRELLGVKN